MTTLAKNVSNYSLWNFLTASVDHVNLAIKTKVTHLVNTVRTSITSQNAPLLDKVGVAIAVTRFWARGAMLAAKLSQKVCEFILISPENLFMANNPVSYQDEKIKIYHAATENKTITKKFVWWLQRCLNEERPLDYISVDFERYAKTFGAQALYCCYSVVQKHKSEQVKHNSSNEQSGLLKNLQHLFIAELEGKIIAQLDYLADGSSPGQINWSSSEIARQTEIEFVSCEAKQIEPEFGEYRFIPVESSCESQIDWIASLQNMCGSEPVMVEPSLE